MSLISWLSFPSPFILAQDISFQPWCTVLLGTISINIATVSHFVQYYSQFLVCVYIESAWVREEALKSDKRTTFSSKCTLKETAKGGRGARTPGCSSEMSGWMDGWVGEWMGGWMGFSLVLSSWEYIYLQNRHIIHCGNGLIIPITID